MFYSKIVFFKEIIIVYMVTVPNFLPFPSVPQPHPLPTSSPPPPCCPWQRVVHKSSLINPFTIFILSPKTVFLIKAISFSCLYIISLCLLLFSHLVRVALQSNYHDNYHLQSTQNMPGTHLILFFQHFF